MNEKNTRFLIETYEPLYEFCPIFECEDGWFDIINDLSAELHYIILKTDCSCRASQVKEKYGTLRYYMDTETSEMSKFIKLAEKRSTETCEYCGEKGKLKEINGWSYTSCDDCLSN
jgi:hypothetical protein